MLLDEISPGSACGPIAPTRRPKNVPRVASCVTNRTLLAAMSLGGVLSGFLADDGPTRAEFRVLLSDLLLLVFTHGRVPVLDKLCGHTRQRRGGARE